MISVKVQPVEGLPVIYVAWNREARAGDARAVTHHIRQLLKLHSTPMYVIVNLQNHPHVPVIETLIGMLSGVAWEPNLCGWIIVGGGASAHHAEHLLLQLVGGAHILWVESCEEARSYVKSALKSQPLEVP